jgi:two-component system chemotaxis sensor kinase CheA
MLLESTDTLRDMVEESVGMQVKHPNGSDATASEEDCTAKSKIRSTGTTGKKTVRLDADRFDRLIDLISELTVSESMVVNDSDLQFVKSPVLERKLSHLDKITKDIQWIAMSLRMVPLRVTFQKMYRLSRDLAVRFNKKIEFVMSGESTELDKSIVDGIGDPLLHIVRNMVDHGIEPVSDRIKAGKSETGRIELRAYHKGSSIYIEISDDGRGLDYKAIAASALEKGLIDSTENYSEAQLTELIFLPSFSTSRMVTDISGRGVGLDVVKRSIEMLQGTVELRSKSGLGTTFILRLPLTLAIMDGLVVRSGIEDYIVPTLNVVSAVRPSPNSIQSVLHQGEIMRYRDSTIPIVRLSRLFGTNDNERDIPDSIVLIIEEEERNIGLMVDKLIGKQQFAVKKLNEGISRAPGISGCTIMPDGSVGLILGAGDFIRTALKLAAHEHSFNGSIAE